jgi:hypothetical protein
MSLLDVEELMICCNELLCLSFPSFSALVSAWLRRRIGCVAVGNLEILLVEVVVDGLLICEAAVLGCNGAVFGRIPIPIEANLTLALLTEGLGIKLFLGVMIDGFPLGVGLGFIRLLSLMGNSSDSSVSFVIFFSRVEILLCSGVGGKAHVGGGDDLVKIDTVGGLGCDKFVVGDGVDGDGELESI